MKHAYYLLLLVQRRNNIMENSLDLSELEPAFVATPELPLIEIELR